MSRESEVWQQVVSKDGVELGLLVDAAVVNKVSECSVPVGCSSLLEFFLHLIVIHFINGRTLVSENAADVKEARDANQLADVGHPEQKRWKIKVGLQS